MFYLCLLYKEGDYMTLVYFILILGITVFVHEFGHFIFAKRAGVYVYEFSLGMGPKLFSFKRKNDETNYAIRMIPIGGFVHMAGEEIEDDKNIPFEKKIQAKSWGQRFMAIVSGALFNFLLAITILFIIGLFYGAPETKPIIGKVYEGYPAYEHGIETGDLIVKINDQKMKTWDQVLLFFELNQDGKALTFDLKKQAGTMKKITIQPIKEEEKGVIKYKYGIGITENKHYGLLSTIKFTFNKFITIIDSMIKVIISLMTGVLGIENLAGPVGIYSIVGEEVNNGMVNTLYLISFLSINVGFINLLPFPAFDGGRVLFLIIEKIKGSKVNPKMENIIHNIGFALLLLLMLIITIQDIRKLFN